MRLDHIIQGAVLSEKAHNLAETQKVYTLKVSIKATKGDIKFSLKKLFNVDVTSVNTVLVRGKVIKKTRSRKNSPIYVKRSNFKKAYVRLKEGQLLPHPSAVPAQA